MGNKKTISFIASLVLLIFLVNFVSAGLCKGYDGYYHDCNDFSDRYYNRNFYPNYKTEYYKETSSSSSSVISIKEDRYNYEEIKASSSAESSIEILKQERDYSYPKTYYRDKYRDYRYNNDRRYFYNDYYKDKKFDNQKKYYDVDNYNDYSDWRYYDGYYNDYYYEPRWSSDKQEFNWRW